MSKVRLDRIQDPDVAVCAAVYVRAEGMTAIDMTSVQVTRRL